MFGSLGVPELLIILVIVLIVFGAGKLPKIGEGLGKALKGFKKEVYEPMASPEQAQAVDAQVVSDRQAPAPSAPSGAAPAPPAAATPTAPATPTPPPPQMGPAATPGTTAFMVAQQAWKPVTPQAPAPSPVGASPDPAQPAFKAVVNQEAMQRVMAQQAAMKPKDQQAAEAAGISDPRMVPPASPPGKSPASSSKGPGTQDLQSLGAGLGDALRTFRQAASDVRRAVDPEMHTIKAEMEAAQKELQATIDEVKQTPKVEPPK